MKKITLSILGLLAFGYVSAQEMDGTTTSYGLTQGDVIAEGSLQWRTVNNKNTDAKESEFIFTPKVGYMVTEKSMLGVQVGFGSATNEFDNGDVIERAKAFEIGVFGRYYFLELGERFKTYGELGLGFGTVKGEVETPVNTTESDDINTVNVGLSLGMNYFLSQNVAISFTLADVLSYGSAKVDADGAEAVTEFNGNINVFNNIFATPTIGLMYKF